MLAQPVLSKIFEHCTHDQFSSSLAIMVNEFDFKKGLSCSRAIYSIRSVIDKYFAEGSTANVCALDLSEAFDRMNNFCFIYKINE